MKRKQLVNAALGIGVAAVFLSGFVAHNANAGDARARVAHPGSLRAATEWRYNVRVSGIPVSDSAGNVIASPFLGGFDVPRPQLVDINGDGQLDLFVQERPDELMYFERVGTEWQWRTDRFQNIDIGEWYRFVDIDGDRDMDLFAEMHTGYIRVWKNAGSVTSPKFEAMGDTVRDVDGRAIVADRQNILNAVDIDCNGRIDLFVGRVQGVVDRYEQDGLSPDGSPRFRMLEEAWQGIEVLGPEAVGGELRRADTSSVESHGPFAKTLRSIPSDYRHGANTLTFADMHGKGILDLFWGDFFEQGLLRFENTGTCAQPNLSEKPTRFPFVKPVLTSGYNAPTFGDIDGDGNIDLVMGVIGGAYEPNRTSIENLYLVKQNPKDRWSIVTRRLIPTIDVGAESAPALADVNGDGLLDLVIGSKVSPADGASGTVSWFENVGTKTAPAFRDRGLLPMHGDYNYAPTIVDLDGDGLPDIVVGTWRDRLQWYRNVGTASAPSWRMADTALVTITRGTNSTPSFGDIDGDGLPDLVIGEASGTINVYKNVSTKDGKLRKPAFEFVSDEFQKIKVGRRSSPVLIDMDGDGKVDMLIGNDIGEMQLWKNVGAKGEMKFERDTTFKLKSYPD
ncbi:MAG: VCBS repeat-containing protein, partial [Gemmatimonadaceae bacterium]